MKLQDSQGTETRSGNTDTYSKIECPHLASSGRIFTHLPTSLPSMHVPVPVPVPVARPAGGVVESAVIETCCDKEVGIFDHLSASYAG